MSVATIPVTRPATFRFGRSIDLNAVVFYDPATGKQEFALKSPSPHLGRLAIGRVVNGTMRRGETVGLLPDQVPDAGKGGDGAWADFFGRPAYTITLAQKFAKTTGALVVMVACVRLAQGAGYRLVFAPLKPFSEDAEVSALELNAAVQRAIGLAADQYLWSYNRYKVPGGIALPARGGM